MVPIPSRTTLAAMLRPEIQKLCKDNNIKANMRTDEMIDALCDLATGKDMPRTQRTASLRTVSQVSRPRSRASVKPPDVPPPKKALQRSEPNTDADAESTPETPAPTAPTTRRKAREIQTRLGKGRPAIAGGSGARAVTRRKTKTSTYVAPRHDPIPEEDEENAADATMRPRPASPAQLPTPTPSHPSHTLPSAHQIATLEARLAHLEGILPAPGLDSTLEARLLELETSTAVISALQSRIDAATQHTARVETDLTQHAAKLGADLERLVAENGALRERVSTLEAMLEANVAAKDDDIAWPTTPRGKRVGSLVIHPPVREEPRELRPGTPVAPSPAQPTLGKRARNDTPDAADSTDDLDRIVRPVRKRARVGSARAEGAQGPSSTSTPRARRSDSPVGFFTVGKRAPTPLARRTDDVDVDIDAYINLVDDDEHEHEPAGPSRKRSGARPPAQHLDAGPSGQDFDAGPSNKSPVPDAGFFGNPPAFFTTPGGTLPFPLHATPSTPPPPTVPAPELYATPALGAPWRHTKTPTPPHERVAGAGYTFRGGRRERNDRYNPYFTPGTTHRTGLTPPPLGSPAKVSGGDGDGEERLRTLYGTELEGDTRFGDFGKSLGRWGADWGKYAR